MPKTLTGKYLVASKQLRDPNFYKSVVLIIEDDEYEGTTGLIINRPSPIRISQAVEDFVDIPETEDCLFIGGPVEPAALFLLHSFVEYQEDKGTILPGIYLGDNAEIFEQVIGSLHLGSNGRWFRIFSGYAGWGPTQLAQEIARGDWLICPAEEDDLQVTNPYEFWEQKCRSASQYQHLLPPIEGTPDWN